MTHEETDPSLVGLIHEVTEEPPDRITGDTRLEALGNWSSLAGLRLLSNIEATLGVWLDLRDYLAAETVGELDAAVRQARRDGPVPGGGQR